MHVICPKENLAKGLQAVQKAVSARGLLPILSNVLVSVQGDELKLVATDLEIGIEASVSADVKTPGTLTLPAKPLSELVSKLPNSDIELDTDETSGQAKVTCGNSTYTLCSLPATDFPPLPTLTDEPPATVPAGLLAAAIRQTIFAASADATKSVLGGVHWSWTGDQLELAATDGYRLAVRTLHVPSGGTEMTMTVPSRILSEVARLLPAGDDPVRIAQIGQQVVFALERKLLSSRLLEGKYPDYHRIIPSTFERRLVVRRQDLLTALERASILASDRSNIVKLHLQADSVTITADTPEVGQGIEIVPANLEGESLEINFNAKFMIDALKAFDSDTVQFDLGGAINPAVLRVPGDEDFTCLLMPIRP
jgi:DNA polymerase-3 subunit beta